MKYIKYPKAEQLALFFSSYGTFMHELIAAYYKGEKDAPTLRLEFLSNYRNCVAQRAPSKAITDNYFRSALAYLRVIEPSQNKVVSVEERFYSEIDGIPFIGFIDRLDETPDGELNLIDNKSRTLKPRSHRKTMKQITKIVFTFENCERMAINTEHIVRIKIDGVRSYTRCNADNKPYDGTTCSGFYICLSDSANTEYIPFGDLFQFKTTVFDRLQTPPDITSCEIVYDDGTSIDIETPWDEAESSKNKFQRNYLTVDGVLHLYIRNEAESDTKGEKDMIKTTTTTTYINEETGEETLKSVIETIEPDSGFDEEDCAGMCSTCDDGCEEKCWECVERDADNDGEYGDDLCEEEDETIGDERCVPCAVCEITIRPYELASRVLSLIALGFSAASAIKLWKKVR